GHGRFVAGFGLIAAGDVEVRFDFKNQIPLFDLLAFLYRQFDELTADFRADFDLQDGLNFAGRHDQFRQVSTLDLFGRHGDYHLAFLQDGGPGRANDDATRQASRHRRRQPTRPYVHRAQRAVGRILRIDILDQQGQAGSGKGAARYQDEQRFHDGLQYK